MALTRWRSPHQITFPGGFVVPVVYWSDEKMKEAQSRDKNKGDPTFEEKDLGGYWDGAKIVINKDQPLWDQVAVWAHELGHAVHDYEWWIGQNVVQPMKAEAGAVVLEDVEDD